MGEHQALIVRCEECLPEVVPGDNGSDAELPALKHIHPGVALVSFQELPLCIVGQECSDPPLFIKYFQVLVTEIAKVFLTLADFFSGLLGKLH